MSMKVLGKGCYMATAGAVFGSIVGTLVGYTYSKLVNLPVAQTVKAYAVWMAAQGAIQTLVNSFIAKEDKIKSMWATQIITWISLSVGISELSKRGLMGGKMATYLITSQLFITLAHQLFAYDVIQINREKIANFLQRRGINVTKEELQEWT